MSDPIIPSDNVGTINPPIEKRPRMTIAERAEAVLAFQRGEMNVPDLCLKYGRSVDVIRRILKKEKAKYNEKAKEVAAEAKKRAEEELKAKTASIDGQRKIREAREEFHKLGTILGKSVGKVIAQSIQKNEPHGLHQPDYKALQSASVALRNAQRIVFESLGIYNNEDDGEDKLPELQIVEMTADQVQQMRKVRSGLDDSMGDAALDEAIVTLEKKTDGGT